MHLARRAVAALTVAAGRVGAVAEAGGAVAARVAGRACGAVAERRFAHTVHAATEQERTARRGVVAQDHRARVGVLVAGSGRALGVARRRAAGIARAELALIVV